VLVRSIPCVNNLSPSDAAEDGERGNKKQSVNEERAYICALQCTQLLTDLETLGEN